MNDKIRQRLSKVYELANQGIAGEKEAAKKALDRLVKKYNVSPDDLESMNQKEYVFKYATRLDLLLFQQLNIYFFEDKKYQIYKDTWGKKELSVKLEYLDYVLISCAYEYFKRHMKKQFNEFCLPLIKRCRTAKTKNNRRKELQSAFFSTYVVKSKIYKSEQLSETSSMSDKQIKDHMKLRGVKGGNYNTQLSSGLYLNE